MTYDRAIGEGSEVAAFDCGGVTNALVNAASSRGLGCVVNSQGILRPSVIRELGKIPDDQPIMICIAMGYRDDRFPANGVAAKRKSVDDE